MIEESEETQIEEATEGTPIALPPEQAAAFQEAVESAQVELPTEEEEGYEEMSTEEAKGYEAARLAAEKARAERIEGRAERAGAAVRGLLTRVGEKIEPSGPPSDDLSDLFEGPDMDKDNDVYVKDLVTVSEEDVFGEGGEDMSDLLEVSDEDIMGEPEESPTLQPKAAFRRTRKVYTAPRSVRGIQ